MNVEIKQLIRERQRLHSAGEHNLRDQLALRIVGLIATRKATTKRAVLRYSRLELVSPLVTIFNHCVNKGIVIDEWRLGNITPIPKVQNPPTPMRPIAITSTPCKIMERIITKQILRLVRVRLLTNKQFGFLTGNTFGNIPQEIVDAVQRWCVDNKMRLNVGKCKMIFINPPRVLGSRVPTVFLLGQ
ncbi:reverse [Brachionus plicatilis]|uniref:Reverse n=1 Tax=Brachionus plicatilis TaxID=10195 RepID=A0A3M7RGD3_BRAPC|nr:reverse [Brachionus plicatilis]